MKQQSKTIQKKAFIGILCSVILIFLDQFTKYLAVQHLKDQMPVVLWKNVLELSYLENRGAAFGIFQGKQWPLIIFTVIVLGGIPLQSLCVPQKTMTRCPGQTKSVCRGFCRRFCIGGFLTGPNSQSC